MKRTLFNNIKEVGENIKSFLMSQTNGVSQERLKNLFDTGLLKLNEVSEDAIKMTYGVYTLTINKKIQELEEQNFVQRVFEKDKSIWNNDPEIEKFMGWLNTPNEFLHKVSEINAFVEKIKKEGYEHIVLLGMGGSSLSSFVFQELFPNHSDFDFYVLDSTVPQSVIDIENSVDLDKTLFIVASKSGSTAEINAFFEYFYDKVKRLKGAKAGKHFIAITDPDTALAKQADKLKFRNTFINKADVGGRYSVLTYFGLLPAAFMEADLFQLLHNAVQAREKSLEESIEFNDSVRLGIVLGELALQGRDKMTLILSNSLSSLGLWIEQLVAESTGKEGKGILPVMHQSDVYKSFSEDRVFVHIAWKDDTSKDTFIRKLEAEGHPVIQIRLSDPYQIAREFYRWQITTAVAGAVLKVNPFDQPNVQENKTCTEELLKKYSNHSYEPNAITPAFTENGIDFFCRQSSKSAQQLFGQIFGALHGLQYIALQAYLPEEPGIKSGMEQISALLGTWLQLPVTIGFGPRFLHSTGQYHKGGPDTGLFIQFTCKHTDQAALPERNYSFAEFVEAQASGDFKTLENKGRRVIRIELGEELEMNLQEVIQMMEKAHLEYLMNLNHTE